MCWAALARAECLPPCARSLCCCRAAARCPRSTPSARPSPRASWPSTRSVSGLGGVGVAVGRWHAWLRCGQEAMAGDSRASNSSMQQARQRAGVQQLGQQRDGAWLTAVLQALGSRQQPAAQFVHGADKKSGQKVLACCRRQRRQHRPAAVTWSGTPSCIPPVLSVFAPPSQWLPQTWMSRARTRSRTSC